MLQISQPLYLEPLQTSNIYTDILSSKLLESVTITSTLMFLRLECVTEKRQVTHLFPISVLKISF